MIHPSGQFNARLDQADEGARDPLQMRDAELRLNDFYEVYQAPDPQAVQSEAKRCMNCGAAFCMPEGGYRSNAGGAAGCPISNRIPEWNRLVELGRWREAYDCLATTNNFPEFTSRVCPAPCQDACIVGINARPVGIKGVERAIIDRAFEQGWVRPRHPSQRTGFHVAIIGSGPAGLAAADELNALGHQVTVYERDDTPGGLLTYGIPNMKLDKQTVQRRITLMKQAGIHFVTSVEVGVDLSAESLREYNDAILLAVGSPRPRDLNLPGRDLQGITQAMPYLNAATRSLARDDVDGQYWHAKDRHVVVIGGGDTGADCIATALRQGAASVVNITRRDVAPENRDEDHPWPGPTGTYQLDYAHHEAKSRQGEDPRAFGVTPAAFIALPGSRQVCAMEVERRHDGATSTERLLADLVILAIGFVGHDTDPLFESFGIDQACLASTGETTSAWPAGVYSAGDLVTGPSLVVHAIAQGQQAAHSMHQDLMLHRKRVIPGSQ